MCRSPGSSCRFQSVCQCLVNIIIKICLVLCDLQNRAIVKPVLNSLPVVRIFTVLSLFPLSNCYTPVCLILYKKMGFVNKIMNMGYFSGCTWLVGSWWQSYSHTFEDIKCSCTSQRAQERSVKVFFYVLLLKPLL